MNDDPPDGVYKTRTKKAAYSDLIGPRQTAWEDQIAAERRRLLQLGAGKGREELAAGPMARRENREKMARAIYRYSKGPDTLNDELGYGEVVIERFWRIIKGKAKVVHRQSQRTKTGRQFLNKKGPAKEQAGTIEPQALKVTSRDDEIKRALAARASGQKLPAQTSRPTRSRR